MQKLEKLTICMDDVANKTAVLNACIENGTTLKTEVAAQKVQIANLTSTLNDAQSKLSAARKSRLIWGVFGALGGAVVYGILVK